VAEIPQTRENLVRLLRDLAGEDAPDPERLAAARKAIESGLLGAPGTSVEDRAGRPVPALVWAASWGDAEMVKLLLDAGASLDAGTGEGGTALHAAAAKGHQAVVDLLLARGASPLALRGTRESVLRVAHPHGRSMLFQTIRRAAKETIDRTGAACHGLATLVFDRRYALRTDRGTADLRRALDGRRALDVLCVRADMKTTVRELANLVQAPRRESDVAARPVQDAQRLLFVYRLRGIDWTIVPFVFEDASPWNVEQVKELAAPGTGIAPMARALASATASRVLHLRYDGFTIYSEHGGIETRPADMMDEELATLGVLVPAMRATTDGYGVQLQLSALEPSDVERADVVVLQEHGDPEIDRRLQLPAAAPARVGPPPVTSLPGAPALVSEPPRVEEPSAPSAAPPMVHEAPPMVPPPMMHAPPPMVPAAAVTEEPPIAVDPGPAPRGASAPPPLVHAPPPMVTTPPKTEEP
jgi:hypothetical protein